MVDANQQWDRPTALRFGRVLEQFDLVDADGDRLRDENFPQCQHGLEIDGDTLLVYDNGTENGWSRATEYTLDVPAGVSTLPPANNCSMRP